MQRLVAACFGFAVALLPLASPAITKFGPAMQASDLVAAVTVLLALVAVARGELRPRWTWADAALAAYVAAAALSAIGSPEPRRSLVKLLGLGLLIALYLLARHLWPDPASRRALIAGWLAGAVVAAAGGVAGLALFYLAPDTANPFIGTYGSLPAGPYARMTGWFNSSNMFCTYLVLALAVVAEVAGELPRARRALLALAAVLVLAALSTVSVGLGGLALGAGLWWHLRGGRHGRLALAAGALVALGFTLLIFVALVPHGRGDFALGPWDVQLNGGNRVAIWRGALRTAAEHPLLGKGYGTLVASTSDPRGYLPSPQWTAERLTDATPVALEAHNVWLNVLGQVGIPGLIAFVAFLVLTLRPASAQPALLAGLVAVLFYHGLFAALEDARHLWVLLGMASARRDSS